MANETEIDPEVAALFEDSGDEGSFDGFNELDRAGLNLDNDSDLDLDDLETEGGTLSTYQGDFPIPGRYRPLGLADLKGLVLARQ